MLNSTKIFVAAWLVQLLQCSAFAAIPAFSGALKLDAPLIAAQASANGKIAVIQLKSLSKRPAGVQIVDSTDPRKPSPMGFIPLANNGEMALSGDGKYLLVSVSLRPIKANDPTHELLWIDLSNSNSPKIVWRRTLTTGKVVLSPGATAYAYFRPSTTFKGDEEVVIIYTKDAQPQRVIKADQFYFKHFSANLGELVISPNADYILKQEFSELAVWNLRSGKQSSPLVQDSDHDGRTGCISAVLDDGYVAVEDSRATRIGLYKFEQDLPRKSILNHSGPDHCKQLNPNSQDKTYIYLAADNTRLEQLDFNDVLRPALGKSWHVPPQASPLAIGGNILFASGTKDQSQPELRLFQLDLEQPISVNWQELAKTHEDILRQYTIELKAKKLNPAWDAAKRFKKAGVLSALDAPVDGVSAQQAAAILNDYGFFEGKHYEFKTAVVALERAVALDPTRAVAHLNLADLLLEHIDDPTITEDAREKRFKAIEEHYSIYLKLGGKRSPGIASFLEGDVGKGTPNVCAAIAAYANAGRLKELVRGGGIGIPMGRKSIDLVSTTEGTAHVPTYYAFDSATDLPLGEEGPQIPSSSGELWNEDDLGLLSYRGQHFIFHYRGFGHPVAARSLTGERECQFEVSTKESSLRPPAEPELCTSLLKGSGPASIRFDGKFTIDSKEVPEIWNEPKIVGSKLLDIANDKNPVQIVEMEYVNGSKFGCSETIYDVVDVGARQFVKSPKHDLLMELQGIQSSNWFPIQPCHNNPRFFSYRDRVYYETKPKNWPPDSDEDKYHSVLLIDQGKIRDVCNFGFAPGVRGKEILVRKNQ